MASPCSSLVCEPRELGGAVVELFEFAGELQQQRAPVVGVRNHLRLPKGQRVRDTLRVAGQRPVRVTHKKKGIAAVGESALPGVVAAKGERLRSVAVDLVEGESAIYMVTGCL
jgi:hypothetical protein